MKVAVKEWSVIAYFLPSFFIILWLSADKAAGGSSAQSLTAAQRAIDVQARQTISRELGHERAQMTAVYE